MPNLDKLTADLIDLAHALERPGRDLEARLRALADTIRHQIESYLGLTITLISDGHPLTVTAMDRLTDPGDITASARLPLDAIGAAAPGSMIVFYAGDTDAFLDLAAELGSTSGLRLILDDHILGGRVVSDVAGLSDLSQVNQAIGILIARGYPPAGARTELRRLAHRAELSLVPAAQRLIYTNRRPPGPASIPA
jgi:hypothetical protein